MSTSQEIEAVRRFVAAINQQDWNTLRSVVSPHFVRHSVAAGDPQVRSADDLVEFLQAEYRTFPDAFEEILEIFADGAMVAARHRFRGTQLGPLGPYEATGRVLESTYIALYRVSDGRIEEAWAEWDNLSGLRQLGLAQGVA